MRAASFWVLVYYVCATSEVFLALLMGVEENLQNGSNRGPNDRGTAVRLAGVAPFTRRIGGIEWHGCGSSGSVSNAMRGALRWR
jgi:hypothetical protein